MSSPWIEIGALVVSGIAALSAWAAQKAATKAAVINNTTNAEVEREATRSDMEKEAYIRARAFDLETIRIKNEEIAALKEERETLKSKVAELEGRVDDLERELHHGKTVKEEHDNPS